MSVSLQGLTRRLPGFAAVAAALVGAINIATALTPNIRWRGHLLLQFEPVETMRVFHALSFPAGVALLLVAPYLAKRRRRAFQSAVALMLALGVFDLLKGLDFEETIVTWSVAIVLIMGRDSFRVRHDAITLRSAIWRVPALGAAGIIAAVVCQEWPLVGRSTNSSLVVLDCTAAVSVCSATAAAETVTESLTSPTFSRASRRMAELASILTLRSVKV